MGTMNLTGRLAVIGLTILQSLPVPATDIIGDRDSYAIYAELLPSRWRERVPRDPLLLQRETETPFDFSPSACADFLESRTGEWAAVAARFKTANARLRFVDGARLRELTVPFTLIDRAEIKAADRELEQRYPGIWNRRPGSIEYAAVSAVGFNATRTKALVYVRLRSSGDLLPMELRDGRWVVARDSEACGWIV